VKEAFANRHVLEQDRDSAPQIALDEHVGKVVDKLTKQFADRAVPVRTGLQQIQMKLSVPEADPARGQRTFTIETVFLMTSMQEEAKKRQIIVAPRLTVSGERLQGDFSWLDEDLETEVNQLINEISEVLDAIAP
jgi:hypothetical protein